MASEQSNAIIYVEHKIWYGLHIGHGNTEKALFFPREDLDEIYAFIKKKNPAIRIMDYAAPEPKSSKKHKK